MTVLYTIESLLDLQIPYRNLMVLYNSMNHQSAKGDSVMGTAKSSSETLPDKSVSVHEWATGMAHVAVETQPKK